MNEQFETPEPSDRRTLIRDVAVFQVKLIVDGFRDLVLVPVSIFAGLLSLVSGEKGRPGPQFYDLLGVGKQTEEWINLFGAMRNAPDGTGNRMPFPNADMDQIVDKIEAFVVDEEKRGGMTSQARERFEQALGSVKRRRRQ